MSDFAVLSQKHNRITLNSSGLEGTGIDLAAWGSSANQITSGGWPSANLAIYVPVAVYQPFIALKMLIQNGTTINGNVDAGIYDDQGDRLVSIGSTAHAGSSSIQSFDITDTTLEPGIYYLACAFDGNTATINHDIAGILVGGSAGVLQQASALPLPATATFAAIASAYVPNIVVTGRTLI